MKTYKQIKEEISNVSSGIGVRGFGDVSGTPKVGDEGKENPHIDRVVQGANEYDMLVKQLIANSTEDIHTFDSDDWWKDRNEIKKYTRKNQQLKEEGEGGSTTSSVGAGTGDNPTKDVYPGKTKQNKRSILMPLQRRLPLQVTQEEIANVSGEGVSTDQPVVRPEAQKNWKNENAKFTARLLKRLKRKK